jgi:hypothetical protein
MAGLSANNGFLVIDGKNVSGFVTKATIKLQSANIDTTAGYGTDWESEAPGLLKAEFEAEIVYDDGGIDPYILALRPGRVVEVIWCPNGNVVDEPMHRQSFHIRNVDGPEVTVKKDMLMFSISGGSTGEPVKNMYEGDVVTTVWVETP